MGSTLNFVLLLNLLAMLNKVQGKEGCSPQHCLQCSELGEVASCNSCAHSFRVFQKNGNSFTCLKPSSGRPGVPNCRIYQPLENGLSDETTCLQCSYGYHSQEGKCAKNTIPHCLIQKLNPNTNLQECRLCMKNHTFNTTSGQCLLVQAQFKIPYCLFYEFVGQTDNKISSSATGTSARIGTNKCAVCEPNYYSTTSKQGRPVCVKSKVSQQCSRDSMKESGCWKCNHYSGWMASNGYNVSSRGDASQMCIYKKEYDLRVLYPDVPSGENPSEASQSSNSIFSLTSSSIRLFLIAASVLLTIIVFLLMASVYCLAEILQNDRKAAASETNLDPRALLPNAQDVREANN